MFDQIKSFFIDSLVTKLQAQGYNINAETVKNALANAPQLMQQIQAILASDSADRMQKIIDLLNQAAGQEGQTTVKSRETDTK